MNKAKLLKELEEIPDDKLTKDQDFLLIALKIEENEFKRREMESPFKNIYYDRNGKENENG